MAGELRSAIVVAFPIPAGIERIRREHVPVANLGVPPHVTILAPFMRAGALDGRVRDRLAAIAGSERAFEVTYRRLGRFPDALYLVPEPGRPFGRLVGAVVEAFPGYPPYGEPSFRVEDVVPHLTIAIAPAGGGSPMDLLEDRSGRSLPFVRRARHMTVLTERDDGRWRMRWRLPLTP